VLRLSKHVFAFIDSPCEWGRGQRYGDTRRLNSASCRWRRRRRPGPTEITVANQNCLEILVGGIGRERVEGDAARRLAGSSRDQRLSHRLVGGCRRNWDEDPIVSSDTIGARLYGPYPPSPYGNARTVAAAGAGQPAPPLTTIANTVQQEVTQCDPFGAAIHRLRYQFRCQQQASTALSSFSIAKYGSP
jgi:hypothetical protein